MRKKSFRTYIGVKEGHFDERVFGRLANRSGLFWYHKFFSGNWVDSLGGSQFFFERELIKGHKSRGTLRNCGKIFYKIGFLSTGKADLANLKVDRFRETLQR